MKWNIKSLNINVNDMCNSKCSYCNYKERGTNEMSPKIINEIAWFVKHWGVEVVHFFGKEPTLSPAIMYKIASEISWEVSENIKFGVTTNGITLSKPRNNVLSTIEDFDMDVLMSYDGVMSEKQRGIKQRTIIKAVERLETIKKRPLALCSVTPAAVNSLAESVSLAFLYGFNGIALNKVTTGIGQQKFNWNDYRRNYRYVLDEWGDQKDFKLPLFESRKEKWLTFTKEMQAAAKNRHTCGACFGGVGLDWDGTIYGCHHPNTDLKLGHILTGIDFGSVRRIQKFDYGECKGCPIFPCSGCYISNYNYSGDSFKLNTLACHYEIVTREIEIGYLKDNGYELKI